MRDVARVKDGHEPVRLLKLLALRNGELFNASRAAVDLGLHRETVDRYLSVLEQLYLVRRLPAWGVCPLGAATRPRVSSVRRKRIWSIAALRQPSPA